MAKKISKTQHDKALKVAQDLVAKVPLREVYDAIVSAIDYQHTDAIAKAIDPKVAQDEKELKAAHLAFISKLDPPTGHEFELLDDKISDKYFWREIAGFYLGAVVAAQLGKGVRR
jgi:23S rRNA maturation-related 3'-5' exoribonuclease YhaM